MVLSPAAGTATLPGRWPRSSHIYNFINHVRQATCPGVVGSTAWAGAGYRNVSVGKTEGAAGQCCSECTKDPACHAWTYTGASLINAAVDGLPGLVSGSPTLTSGRVIDHCTLFGAGATRQPAAGGVVSGTTGQFPTALVSLPQQFKQSGYLVMQTGKLWHTEEGSPSGTGMPPQQDYPLSWSDGCSMADVNEVRRLLGLCAVGPCMYEAG